MKTIKYALFVLLITTYYLYPQIPTSREFTLPERDSIFNSTIVTLSNNNLAAFWVENSNLYFSKSSDFGINWETPVHLLPDVSFNDSKFYAAMVTLSGRIILIYKNSGVYVTYSDDNGDNFSGPQQLIINLSSASNNFKLTETTNGHIFFSYTKGSWGVYYKKSINNGEYWENEITASNIGIAKGIYTSSNGNIHLFFSSINNLYKIVSSDNGVTWNSAANLGTKKNCSIILAGDILYVGYEDSISMDIIFEKSTDFGNTWFDMITYTKYLGNDNAVNLQRHQDKVLFSFSSERAYSYLIKKVQRYFGILNVTEDLNTPPVLSDINFFPTQWYNLEFNIEVEALDYEGVESVILIYNFNGLTDSAMMINTAPEKYQINLPGQDSAYNFSFNILVNDIDGNSVLFGGDSVIVNQKWFEINTLFDVNKIILPLNNYGVIGDVYSPLYLTGGFYEENPFLFSGGFFLSGKTENQLWANAVATADLIVDYDPGPVSSNPIDTNYIVYTIHASDPPFGISWQMWSEAVQLGADYYDGNQDGSYTPVDLNNNGVWDLNEDRPDIIGDRISWCVYNDGKPDSLRRFNDVSPQGIEIHQSVFGNYPSNHQIENIIYIRYRIFNTGTVAPILDSVYFSIWSDPDLGVHFDDLVGTDTVLKSVYVYNEGPDAQWGANPPAFFQQIVQGPLAYIPGETFVDINGNGIYDPGIDTPLDSAKQNYGLFLGNEIFPGAKNLSSTSSVDYLRGDITFGAPTSKTEAWNYMQGKLKNGNLIDPCTWSHGTIQGGVNCSQINPLFIYSGDPVTDFGWINTTVQDHRMMVNTGPFILKINEPVDIIAAYILGRGHDHLNSITKARQNASYALEYYKTNFTYLPPVGIYDDESISIAENFILYQNFPNPFNPITKIKYYLPELSKVTLKVFDILGREVKTLVNAEQNTGNYDVDFNASNFSSGLYFYELRTQNFCSVKKMIFLK